MNWGNVAPADGGGNSGNQKNMMMLLIGAVIIVAAALAFYFLYFIRTPAYSMKLAYEAFKKADYPKFEQYVDVKATYNSATWDLSQITVEKAGISDPEAADATFAASESMFKATEPDVEEAVKKLFAASKEEQKASKKGLPIIELSGLSNNMSWKDADTVSTKDNRAIVAVKFHDEDLNKDYSLNFNMEKDGDHWKVVGIDNLYEVSRQRKLDNGGEAPETSLAEISSKKADDAKMVRIAKEYVMQNNLTLEETMKRTMKPGASITARGKKVIVSGVLKEDGNVGLFGDRQVMIAFEAPKAPDSFEKYDIIGGFDYKRGRSINTAGTRGLWNGICRAAVHPSPVGD